MTGQRGTGLLRTLGLSVPGTGRDYTQGLLREAQGDESELDLVSKNLGLSPICITYQQGALGNSLRSPGPHQEMG